MADSVYQLLVGIGVPVALFTFGLWIRAEMRHKQEFKDLTKENEKAHREIREAMTKQHSSLRDKIEAIWQHLVNPDK